MLVYPLNVVNENNAKNVFRKSNKSTVRTGKQLSEVAVNLPVYR